MEQLRPGYIVQRPNIARQVEAIFEANDNLILLKSYAHFHLNVMVNPQNYRYLTLENSRELHERTLHIPKVTVWCTFGKARITGPYFLNTIMEILLL